MMEQVEVCNSWEEFDDNKDKLLEQQLEKLKLHKGCQKSTPAKPNPEETSQAVDANTAPIPKMRILKRNVPVTNSEPIQNGTTTTTSIASTNGIVNNDNVIIQDDSFRTQYVPPEPRISILSRPKKNSPRDPAANDSSSNTNQSKTKGQVKTLEQREQEYAEARKRIFGDDPPPEDEQEESTGET